MTHIYQLNDNELLGNINKTMGVVVDGLRMEGFLTEQQAEQIHTHYSIIIESRAWLPKFLAEWLGIKDNLTMRLVKAVGRAKHQEIKEKNT